MKIFKNKLLVKNLSKSFALLLMGTVLVACDNASFHSETKPGFVTESVKTFAVIPVRPGFGSTGEKVAQTFRYGDTIKQSISENLIAMGYEEVPANEADMTLVVRGNFSERTEVTEWPGSPRPVYGHRGVYWVDDYWMSSVDIRTYEVGTIAVEAYVGETDEVVWIGWSDIQNVKSNPSLEKVDMFFDKILSEFPNRDWES